MAEIRCEFCGVDVDPKPVSDRSCLVWYDDRDCLWCGSCESGLYAKFGRLSVDDLRRRYLRMHRLNRKATLEMEQLERMVSLRTVGAFEADG